MRAALPRCGSAVVVALTLTVLAAAVPPQPRPVAVGSSYAAGALAGQAEGEDIAVEIPDLIDELMIIPGTGTDTTVIRVTTEGGCRTPSDRFSVRLIGPGAFARGATVVEPTAVGFSTTAPITVALQKTLAAVAAELGTALTIGSYQLILVCLDGATGRASGGFLGTLRVTSPTSYGTAPPGPSPTPTPTPTPTPSPTPTSTPSPSPSPTPTPSLTAGPTSAAPAAGGPTGGGPGGRLSYTGAPLAELIAAGVVLSLLGGAFLFASRRRPSVPPIEERP